MKPIKILSLLVVAVSAILVLNSAFTVRETEQAMVLTLGKVDRLISEPGLKFKTPFVQNIIYFDKRILETDARPTEFVTKDKKRLMVDNFTRWRIVDAKTFYEAVQNTSRAKERLNVILDSSMREVIGRETLVDVVSGDRNKMMNSLLTAVREKASTMGIDIVDVRIKRTDLPEKNSRAVFERMKAERDKESKEIRAQGAEEAQKLRADAERKRTILLAEAQRDAQKLRGEGDAESIRITAAAFNADPEFYGFIRSLDAYRISLKNDTLLVLDPSMDFFKYMNNSN